MDKVFGGKPVGEYVVGRYSELKAAVKENNDSYQAGPASEPTDRFQAYQMKMKDGTMIIKAEVDDHKKTDDFIKTMREQPRPSEGVATRVIMEEFKERDFRGKTVLTFNYLEALTFVGGERMQSSMIEHFDPQTGQKIYMPVGD